MDIVKKQEGCIKDMWKVAILTLLAISAYGYANNMQPEVIVTHTYDGDTFTVESFEGGKFIKKYNVRIADIDTKELRQKGQDGIDADKARLALMNKLVGQKVDLINCVWDAYRGRDTCDVYLKGQNVGSWMVFTGNAFDYEAYSKGRYAVDQIWAQRLKRGVWANNDGGERPWNFRHSKTNKK